MTKPIVELIAGHSQLENFPSAHHLSEIIQGRTFLTASGYPFISEAGFIRFIRQVPHLFADGTRVLDWVNQVKQLIRSQIPESEEKDSMLRGVRVLRTMACTAGVTAPPDLWLMRHILSSHKKLGILDYLLAGNVLDPEIYAKRNHLDQRQLKVDLHFLYARGYLDHEVPCFLAPLNPESRINLEQVTLLDDRWKSDLTAAWTALLAGKADAQTAAMLDQLLVFQARHVRSRIAWVATLHEIEVGYRLLPIVLALRSLELTQTLSRDSLFAQQVPNATPALIGFLEEAGLLSAGLVTYLGERVFKRGPGPYGIIGAYYPYLIQHEALLSATQGSIWVSRGENVAASQDANQKTFRAANQALDAFCRDHDFSFTTYIEHAVGKGEATRQRLELSGEENIRYFGADLEDAAIDAAMAEQKRGRLPRNMQFIRQADIGRPEKITDHLRSQNIETRGAVMIVGNGFHEIRNQTNETMLAVFRGYQEAGILLLFTEETGLTDMDLRATAWNTYHAGFRHVHEMSGQGLRPSWDTEFLRNVWSWRGCAERAGYVVLDKYTKGTRPIYPISKKGRENPSISVNYFCIPRYLAKKYGLVPEPHETRYVAPVPPKEFKPVVLWFTGLSGAGKTTIARKVMEKLEERAINAAWLDGDVTREYFPKTGFSKEERDAHILRSGFVAKMLVEHGVTVVASYISPYAEVRAKVREMCGHFIEIYVSTPLSLCEERDVKGLYAKVRKGEINHFTGVDDPYEEPVNPELVVDTRDQTVDQACDQVLRYLNMI